MGRGTKVLLAVLLTLFFSLPQAACVSGGPPQIIAFQTSPEMIAEGETATLVWAVTGADTVTIEPGPAGVAQAGTHGISPDETTTYTLTAGNRVGEASLSVTVTVLPGVNIISFEASPVEIARGEDSTLEWSVQGADSVTIEPDIGEVEVKGSSIVSPDTTTTYTLIAQGGTTSVTRAIVVAVNTPPVVATFTAFPEQIANGRTTMLRWNVSGAETVRIEPDIGDVPLAGSYSLIPDESTTYILTARNECCLVSRALTVTVTGSADDFPYGPVVELFNVSPGSIYRGQTAVLEWRVSRASEVRINQGIGVVPHSGSIVVSPVVDTTYTMTVTNQYAFYPVSVTLLVYEP